MTAWRVIITDTESETGIAPVCEDPAHNPALHDDDPSGVRVFDCCPYPQIELWDERAAARAAELFTQAAAEAAEAAEVCS